MAGMTSVLTKFSEQGNSKTSSTSTNTAVKPRLVIEKRKTASPVAPVAEYSARVLHATENSDGVILGQKVSFEVIVRYPIMGDNADVTAALAIFRDIVAGDEFGNSIATLEFLK